MVAMVCFWYMFYKTIQISSWLVLTIYTLTGQNSWPIKDMNTFVNLSNKMFTEDVNYHVN